MNNKFKSIRITDNFYQSSSFFPMPLTLIGTLNEDGSLTSYGAGLRPPLPQRLYGGIPDQEEPSAKGG